MFKDRMLYVAQGENRLGILPKMANRHGLIAGATGTGKTTTVKVLAESFSDAGVPVFLADVKGDLSGMVEPGTMNEKIAERTERFGITDFSFKTYPSRFWDIFGEVGHPVRVTVSQMGPMLLSSLLGLTDAQSGVLSIVFKIADDYGLKLLDYKDLRSMLQYVGDNRAEFTLEYGNISTASVGAIHRALLQLEDEGGDFFFGEPALDITDWMRTDMDGRGYINIFNSTKLISNPKVYATFLLWLITELFERLPEIGDPEKPRMVFFFDEAHLLFSTAPKSLLQKIVQVVKLIRSKGVGIYFISQSPSDIPNDVLSQLSNRIQHALRAYTPQEQKALKATAQAFRENPSFKTIDALTELAVGEALVSFLDEDGIPMVVERAMILPPQSKMGPGDESVVERNILSDEFEFKYRNAVDNESAYEILMAAREELARQEEEARIREEEEKAEALRIKEEEKAEAARIKEEEKAEAKRIKEEEKAEALRIKEEEKERARIEKELAKEEQKALALQEKAALQAQKEAERKQNMAKKAVTTTAQRAASSAASSVARSVSTNLVNSVVGGKKTDAKTIGKRAATNALSSVMRTGANSLVRGLFGNLK